MKLILQNRKQETVNFLIIFFIARTYYLFNYFKLAEQKPVGPIDYRWISIQLSLRAIDKDFYLRPFYAGVIVFMSYFCRQTGFSLRYLRCFQSAP